MVKLLFSFLLLATLVNAEELNLLQEKIVNLIGENKYSKNREYIDILFTPEAQFYKNNRLDVVQVMQILVQNRLFSSKLPFKRELKINLKTDGSPALFVKLMKDSLRNLGYYRYSTLSSDFNGNKFVWSISFQSNRIPDIIKIQEQLSKVGSFVVDIEKNSINEWSYKVDISRGSVESVKVYNDENIFLKHSLDPYWIDIKSVKKLLIKSSRRNSWYPQIAIFDTNLKLLKMIKQDKRTNRITIQFPVGSCYMSVSDIYTMKNIKDSLTLYPKRAR